MQKKKSLRRALLYKGFDSIYELLDYAPIFQIIMCELELDDTFVARTTVDSGSYIEDPNWRVCDSVLCASIYVNAGEILSVSSFYHNYSIESIYSPYIAKYLLAVILKNTNRTENMTKFINSWCYGDIDAQEIYREAEGISSKWHSVCQLGEPIPCDLEVLGAYELKNWKSVTAGYRKSEILRIIQRFKTAEQRHTILDYIEEAMNTIPAYGPSSFRAYNDREEIRTIANFDNPEEYHALKDKSKNELIVKVAQQTKKVEELYNRLTKKNNKETDDKILELENKNEQFSKELETYKKTVENLKIDLEKVSAKTLDDYFCEIVTRYIEVSKDHVDAKRIEAANVLRDIKDLLKLNVPRNIIGKINNLTKARPTTVVQGDFIGNQNINNQVNGVEAGGTGIITKNK